jgi:Skp family chaperone for outer membrane proteins
LSPSAGTSAFAQGAAQPPAQPPAQTPPKPAPLRQAADAHASADASARGAASSAISRWCQVRIHQSAANFPGTAAGKTAVGRINTLTQKKQSEFQAKQKAMADNQQKLQSSGGVMSDAARGQLEKEIERQNTEIQRFQQDAQAEINELQNEVQAEFVKKVNPIIDAVAKEKGLQIVFNGGDAGFRLGRSGTRPDVRSDQAARCRDQAGCREVTCTSEV